jgi:hypothetical protein
LGCGTRFVVLFTSRVRHYGAAAKLTRVYTHTSTGYLSWFNNGQRAPSIVRASDTHYRPTYILPSFELRRDIPISLICYLPWAGTPTEAHQQRHDNDSAYTTTYLQMATRSRASSVGHEAPTKSLTGSEVGKSSVPM